MTDSCLMHREGVWSFVNCEGQPYFLLGVNHIDKRDPDTLPRLRAWGFNSAGHDPPKSLRHELPFLCSVGADRCSHYLPADDFAFEDVFDQTVVEAAGRRVGEVCSECRANPYFIGYSLADTPQWDLARSRATRGTDWVSAIRVLQFDRPGKRAYLEFLRQRYPSAEAWSEVYNLPKAYLRSPSRADDYSIIDLTRDQVRSDDEAFLGIIAEQYYGTMSDVVRRHDPQGLRFGDRFKAHDLPAAVLEAAARHTDVLSVQPGPEVGPLPGPGRHESVFDRAYFDDLHVRSGRPILICDHTVSFRTEAYPVTLWHQFTNQNQAGQAIAKYLTEAAACPYVVGYIRCQYYSTFLPDRGLLKQGLVDPSGNVYSALVDYHHRANKEASKFHAKKFA